MPLNTDPNFPPSGDPPYSIDREWCLGDSLVFMNRNFQNFDSRIVTLSSTTNTQINNLQSSLTTTLSTIPYARLNDGNQSGIAPIYGCRAWATWAGTAANGPVAFTGGNVISVSRISSGLYEVTFLKPMSDINYAISVASSANLDRLDTNTPRSGNSFRIEFFAGSGTFTATNPA